MTFLEFLSSQGVAFKRHSWKPNEVWICCPFCNDERYRLGVNIASGMGHCFNGTCNFRARNVSQAFATRFRVTLADQDTVDPQETPKVSVHLPDDFERLTEQSIDPLFRRAKKYAYRRGLTDLLAKRWRVGVSLSGRYSYRVIFPIFYERQLVGMVGRDFTGTQTPKYLMSSGKKFIWGARAKAELVLAEGIFKAINIEKATGLPAGAMLGHTITQEMQEQLNELGVRRILIWPDPDRAGVLGLSRVCNQLQEAGFCVYLPKKLPELPADEADASEIVEVASFVPFRQAMDKYRLEVS